MANLASDRLRDTLLEIVRRREGTERTDQQILSALLDTCSLIDMCHRARQLVRDMPCLRRKKPCFRLFLSHTAHIEKIRHYFQHFHQTIPKIPPSSSPLWGALSWVLPRQPLECYTAFTGNTSIPGVNAPSISFDRRHGRFTTQIAYYVGTEHIDIELLGSEMKTLGVCLMEWANNQTAFATVPATPANVNQIPIISFSVQPPSEKHK